MTFALSNPATSSTDADLKDDSQLTPDFHRFVLLLIQGPNMVVQKMAGNLDGFDMKAGDPYDI